MWRGLAGEANPDCLSGKYEKTTVQSAVQRGTRRRCFREERITYVVLGGWRSYIFKIYTVILNLLCCVTAWKLDELRQVLMPTLEKLYRLEPESIPFRHPVDPQLQGIPVSDESDDQS